MICLDCGGELKAVGGVPTVWHCDSCTKEKTNKRSSKPDVRFIGDTLKTLRRI